MAKPGSDLPRRETPLGKPEVGLLELVFGQHQVVTGVHACDRRLQSIPG